MNTLKSTRLIASDLDGTLLRSDKRISQYSASVLDKALSQGKQVVLATGRHFLDVKSKAQSAGFATHLISANGAQVHLASGELLFERFVQPELIEPLVKAARDLAMVNINFYNKNKWFISRETEWVKNNRSQIPLEYEVMNLIEPPTEEILKVYFTALEGGEDCLLELEQTLLSRFGDKLSICFSSPQCLEVMDLGINKLSGLKALSKSLGIDLNHCIAFGDGMNDIEMLSGVGKGLFMGTTALRPKEALPKIEVIGDADDDAVAHYIEEHLL